MTYRTLLTSALVFVPLLAAADYEQERQEMVRNQIERRGIIHEATLKAMRTVPRHLFVPPGLEDYAYFDRPLPIGQDQTISQPFIVAYMTEQLQPEPHHRALEIGTGSGYQAAVLAEIVDEVYTIEIIPELAKQAEKRLKTLGYKNIQVKAGDGYHGWPEHAPFDLIIVTAAPEEIPPKLIEQLKEGGRMIIPAGETSDSQNLILVTKKKGKSYTETLIPVRFVPFTRDEDN